MGACRSLVAFVTDVVEVMREEVRELVRLGCTSIQLDAPHYPMLIDPAWRASMSRAGGGRWAGQRGDRRRAAGWKLPGTSAEGVEARV